MVSAGGLLVLDGPERAGATCAWRFGWLEPEDIVHPNGFATVCAEP